MIDQRPSKSAQNDILVDERDENQPPASSSPLAKAKKAVRFSDVVEFSSPQRVNTAVNPDKKKLLFQKFSVSSFSELFALPQFADTEVDDAEEFCKYRLKAIEVFRETAISLGPEVFLLSALFKINQGTFNTYILSKLQSLCRDSCKVCNSSFENKNSAFRHWCSIEHADNWLKTENEEPREIAEILKFAKNNNIFGATLAKNTKTPFENRKPASVPLKDTDSPIPRTEDEPQGSQTLKSSAERLRDFEDTPISPDKKKILFERFAVSNFNDLFALPQFVHTDDVLDFEDFCQYRQKAIEVFNETVIRLGPEVFDMLTLYRINLGVFNTYTLSGLKSISQTSCEVCNLSFENKNFAFRHWCSIEHAENTIKATEEEPKEVAELLKFAKNNNIFGSTRSKRRKKIPERRKPLSELYKEVASFLCDEGDRPNKSRNLKSCDELIREYENTPVDPDKKKILFEKFAVTTFEELYALPQFVHTDDVLDFEDFCRYRQRAIKALSETIISLGPEVFDVLTLYRINLGGFNTYTLSGLKSISQTSCEVCNLSFENKNFAFRHWCSIEHAENSFKNKEQEPKEVAEILKFAKNNNIFGSTDFKNRKRPRESHNPSSEVSEDAGPSAPKKRRRSRRTKNPAEKPVQKTKVQSQGTNEESITESPSPVLIEDTESNKPKRRRRARGTETPSEMPVSKAKPREVTGVPNEENITEILSSEMSEDFDLLAPKKRSRPSKPETPTEKAVGIRKSKTQAVTVVPNADISEESVGETLSSVEDVDHAVPKKRRRSLGTKNPSEMPVQKAKNQSQETTVVPNKDNIAEIPSLENSEDDDPSKSKTRDGPSGPKDPTEKLDQINEANNQTQETTLVPSADESDDDIVETPSLENSNDDGSFKSKTRDGPSEPKDPTEKLVHINQSSLQTQEVTVVSSDGINEENITELPSSIENVEPSVPKKRGRRPKPKIPTEKLNQKANDQEVTAVPNADINEENVDEIPTSEHFKNTELNKAEKRRISRGTKNPSEKPDQTTKSQLQEAAAVPDEENGAETSTTPKDAESSEPRDRPFEQKDPAEKLVHINQLTLQPQEVASVPNVDISEEHITEPSVEDAESSIPKKKGRRSKPNIPTEIKKTKARSRETVSVPDFDDSNIPENPSTEDLLRAFGAVQSGLIRKTQFLPHSEGNSTQFKAFRDFLLDRMRPLLIANRSKRTLVFTLFQAFKSLDVIKTMEDLKEPCPTCCGLLTPEHLLSNFHIQQYEFNCGEFPPELVTVMDALSKPEVFQTNSSAVGHSPTKTQNTQSSK